MYRKIFTKRLFLLLCVFASSVFTYSQTEKVDTTSADSSIHRLQVYDGFDLPSDFKSKYRNALRRVRRVYPLALEAANVIDSLENELADEKRNRKKNKLMRKTHKSLKNDFKYLLKDLYISEGKVLMKLIYRETGLTVSEIISKYRSGFHATIYGGLAGFFEQDLDSKYYPDTEDFVIECVVQDIKSGKVAFDPELKRMTKEEFKEEKRKTRKRKRKYRKRRRNKK